MVFKIQPPHCHRPFPSLPHISLGPLTCNGHACSMGPRRHVSRTCFLEHHHMEYNVRSNENVLRSLSAVTFYIFWKQNFTINLHVRLSDGWFVGPSFVRYFSPYFSPFVPFYIPPQITLFISSSALAFVVTVNAWSASWSTCFSTSSHT